MKTLRMEISASEAKGSIPIPEEFRDEDLYVTITAFDSRLPRRNVKVNDLVGVAKDPCISLDEMRYERLMAR